MELTKHQTGKTISSQIENAVVNGTPIHSAPETELRTALLYGMTLIGITGDKAPDKAKHERDLIIVNLRKKFPSIKLEEVRIAFEMYANGELEGTDELYGRKFNYQFISKIIRSYRDKYRNEVITEMNKRMNAPQEPTEDEIKESKRVFIEKCIIPPLEQFETLKTLDFGLVDVGMVYRYFDNAGLIDVSKVKRKHLGIKYREEVRSDWQQRIEKKATSKDEHDFKKRITEALKDEQTGDFAKEVVRRCKLDILTNIVKEKGTEVIVETLINQLT